MKISEWFDVTNKDHLKAYKHLLETGKVPYGFVPDDVFFHDKWQFVVMEKLAIAYISEKLK